MLFSTKTPSHLLAWRALAYHLLPLAIFAAGFICDPTLRLWSAPEGHITLILLFDLMILCAVLSLVALVRAWDELVGNKVLILPLFVADVMLALFILWVMHG